MPPVAPPQPTEACPGCGAVLVRLADGAPSHPGASASCARLFEVTLRGLREETGTDAATAAVARLDVIDLRVLVEAWARSVREDWTAVSSPRQ